MEYNFFKQKKPKAAEMSEQSNSISAPSAQWI
jgi:hypothetical protein